MQAQLREPATEGARDGTVGGLSDKEIREWASDSSVAKNIAADLAANINKGRLRSWNDLPDNAKLADEYGTSTRTVGRAKRLLAGHGLIVKSRGRYYVA